MRLHHLLDQIQVTTTLEDYEITELYTDSRLVEPGSLYIAVKGREHDGHDYAQNALDKGAVAVLCERDLGLKQQILCTDTRGAYAILTAELYGNPHKKLCMIGVTGTNGKTTVSTMIKDMLESCGYRVGLLGTIEARVGDKSFPAKHTTPDPKTLYSLLDAMVKYGCTHCVMEVSSHGLDQRRVEGITFEVAVFTNLTQDHLDYHGTMEEYYQAKRRLFLQANHGVINLDDSYGQRLQKECSCNVVSFSLANDAATLTAHNIQQSLTKTNFVAVGENEIYRASIPMAGEFGVSNGLAAICACSCLGIPKQKLFDALSVYRGVSGRLEVLYSKDYTIIRDYAHTPDGLEKLLTAVRAVTAGRVISLFGCAGNRDRTKRQKMARIASTLADFVILTSDNPRGEDMLAIIEDAKIGLISQPDSYIIIPDRYKAIEWGIDNILPGDTLVLAGKGHENYQVLKFGTVHFDEKEIVEKLLKEKNIL